MGYLKNRLLEIKERLGPLTHQLGLKHRLRRDKETAYLYFEQADNNETLWHSSVIFVFPLSPLTGEKEISWSNVRLAISGVHVDQIGDNGWVRYRGGGDNVGEPVTSVDKAFADARAGLQEIPLVPEYFAPGILENDELADIWERLRTACLEHGVNHIEVSRDADQNESYSLEFDGHSIEIIYVSDYVRFMVDGEHVRTASKWNSNSVLLQLEWVFRDLQERLPCRDC